MSWISRATWSARSRPSMRCCRPTSPSGPTRSVGRIMLGSGGRQADAPRGRVDVDDEVMTLLRFQDGAVGSLEATRNAYGRHNFLTFEIHGDRRARCTSTTSGGTSCRSASRRDGDTPARLSHHLHRSRPSATASPSGRSRPWASAIARPKSSSATTLCAPSWTALPPVPISAMATRSPESPTPSWLRGKRSDGWRLAEGSPPTACSRQLQRQGGREGKDRNSRCAIYQPGLSFRSSYRRLGRRRQ